MLPANESFEPADLVIGEIDDRLVVKFEFAGGQCLPQVLFQYAPSLHLHIHLRLKEAESAPPVALGPIESQVTVPDQLVWDQAVRGRHGEADARTDDHLMAVDLVGLANRRDDPLSK